MTAGVTILDGAGARAAVPDLVRILHGCVEDGASVGFIHPFPLTAAEAFWRETVLPAVDAGRTRLFVVKASGRIEGTVQLGLALPPNQPHRADVAKMLVHPTARRQGLARRLLAALEDEARRLGRTLLVLDTRSGDPAGLLYRSAGFHVAGEIPGYCRNPAEERYEATTYMYKALA